MADGHNKDVLGDISRSTRDAYASEAEPGVWPVGGGPAVSMTTTPVSEILDNPGSQPGTPVESDDPAAEDLPVVTGGRTRSARKSPPAE